MDDPPKPQAQPASGEGDDRAALLRLSHEARATHRRFQAILERLLGRPHRRALKPPPGLDLLTDTERMLVERIVRDDEKYSAIWTGLGMAKRTFETHLDSIYSKLRVRRRSGLVRVVLGWV